MGTNDTVKHNLGKVKQNFRALGTQVKGTDAQVKFSSVRDRHAGITLQKSMPHADQHLALWLVLPGFWLL